VIGDVGDDGRKEDHLSEDDEGEESHDWAQEVGVKIVRW
jgi:hypothetical protein